VKSDGSSFEEARRLFKALERLTSMDRTAIVMASALCLLSAERPRAQGPEGQAGQPSATWPVSLERVRTGLQRSVALRLPSEPDAAHFRVDVTEEYWRIETVLEAVRRELAADVAVKHVIPTGGPSQPLVSVDLLRLGLMLKDQLNAARRARAERNARREVQEALAEFCAAHDCSVLSDDPHQSITEGVLTH